MKILLALVFGVFVAVVAAIIILGRDTPTGFTYIVTFTDIDGLKKGDAVTLEGNQVGEVTELRQGPGEDAPWEVTLLIYPDFRGAVRQESSARIVSSGLLRRSAEVRLLNRGGEGEPIRQGTVVRGVDTWAEEQIFFGRDAARRGLDQLGEGWDKISRRLGETMDDARDWFSSPEARGIKDRLENLRMDIQNFTATRAEEAGEKLQESLARGRELILELRDLGRDDLADEVSESLDTMREQYDEIMEAEEGETP